jgi:hypothetical protein
MLIKILKFITPKNVLIIYEGEKKVRNKDVLHTERETEKQQIW